MTSPDRSRFATTSFQQSPLPAIGAILAGGASVRFGSEKGLAEVGGVTILERVRRVVAMAVTDPVLITHLPSIAAAVDLPTRPDTLSGRGPLAGVVTALDWAREEGKSGALCVASDLPFLPVSLLREIVTLGLDEPNEIVLPAGRDGLEPLCAWYPVSAAERLAGALESGDLKLVDLIRSLPHKRIHESDLSAHGDPAIMFFNVNTRASLDRANELEASAPRSRD